MKEKSGRRGLTTKQPLTGPASPWRSVCAPGEFAVNILQQTLFEKETRTMSFSCVRDFLTSLSPRSRRARRRPTPGTRLRLEALEDRCLLSNYATGPLVQVSVTNPFAGST